ncbi:hypothetical protein ACO2Q0_02680 [Phenylobacterium sp. VNQ135]|uniref:hypothetical protein n=1 Tax=Phenylobacterium sp. VNQ135 TaxID=3400922 RepID=UPI003C0BB5B0
MAQPKTPPISIRPSAALLAEVDEWAKARGLKRHAALLALIDFGLGVASKPSPPAAKPEAKRKAATPKPEPFKTRLKGEWKAP